MRHRGALAVVPPLLLAGVVVGFLLALEGTLVRASGQTPGPAPSAGAGRALFLRDCAWCHGNSGEGASRGPSLIGTGAAGADFQLITGRMPLTRVEEEPTRRTPRYDPRQITDLVRFVASLGPGPDIPRVDPASGDLQEGTQLYLANCAACHSSTGAGGALTSGQFAPPLYLSTPTQVGEAVRLGPGTMPAFGPGVLSDHDLDSVARYVGYLQHPDDRGGAGLGRIGPVGEGLVGLALGLGALVALVRWIGTRS